MAKKPENSPDLNSREVFSFREIADHWSRESGKKSSDEILNLLVRTLFQREFPEVNLDFILIVLLDTQGLPRGPDLEPGDQPSLPPKLSIKCRTVANSPDVFVFRHRDEEIDLRVLAEAPIGRYPPRGQRTLGLISLSRGALFHWCSQEAIDFPQFWRRPGETKTSLKTAPLEARCMRWIRSLSERTRKSDVKKEAMELYPGLSERQFNRAWAKSAPVAWKRPGAIRKSRR